jgi:hypothetical protein
MTSPITGKVAAVNSDRELIINKGAGDGVEAGMLFRVKGPDVTIKDPDTGDILGKVSKVKVVVRVEEVADRFSIARTFRTRRVNIGGEYDLTGGLARMLQPPRWETRVETLRRNTRDGESIDPSESVVSVGDIVETADEGDEDAVTTTTWR